MEASGTAPPKLCRVCEQPIPADPGHRRHGYCTTSCHEWHRRHPGELRRRRPCERCGTLLELTAPSTKRWCGSRCRSARKDDPHREQLEAVSRPPDERAIDLDLVPWLMTPGTAEPLGFLPPAPAWMGRAACRGMPLGRFVGDGRGWCAAEALAVCAGCPVRVDCASYALADPDLDGFGIFGGMTARERRRLGRLTAGEAA